MPPSALVRALRLLAPLALLLTAALRLPAADAYAFRTVAMGSGGFVSGLVFHPTERNLLYARTDVGATRTRVSDDRHQFGCCNDLAGDPNTFGRLYIGTGGPDAALLETLAPAKQTTPSSAPMPKPTRASLSWRFTTALEPCMSAPPTCSRPACGLPAQLPRQESQFARLSILPRLSKNVGLHHRLS